MARCRGGHQVTQEPLTGHRSIDATLSDFREFGRKDADFISEVFRSLIEGAGGAIPATAVDTFNTWCLAEVNKCAARLRDTGATEDEIAAWRRGLVSAVKRNNANAVKAIRQRGGQ